MSKQEVIERRNGSLQPEPTPAPTQGTPTMDIFEAKTGLFTPLAPDQLPRLSTEQRIAYDALALAADELNAANQEASEAHAAIEAAVAALDAAKVAESKRPKWSALDEWKVMTGRKPSHAPMANNDLADAQAALSDRQAWNREVGDRVRVARGTLGQCVTAWQVAIGGTVTFEQLAREHIASENRLRAERIANGQRRPEGRPGPSAVDQFAFATRKSGRGAGGGRSFARGGVTQVEALRRNAERVKASIHKPAQG